MSDKIRDFHNTKILVELNPRFSMLVDESTGEFKPKPIKNSKAKKKQLTIILNPYGLPLEPHNSYLHNLLRKGAENTNTAAQALLSFTRYLTAIGKSYRDVTDNELESPAWLYGDWLLDTLTIVDPSSRQLENNNGYSLNTARTYMGVVINFYKWLHRENILPIDDYHKPFEFRWVRMKRGGVDQHNILGHISGRKSIEVQTTNLIQRFPKIQSTPSWMKLKPLTQNDKAIFEGYISATKGADEVKSLMCKFALATGVRIQELVTFPDDKIALPANEADTPYTISPANGCATKFNKQRTIIIPFALMLELYEYKLSRHRASCLKQAGLKLNKQEQQTVLNKDGVAETSSKPHGRLFVSESGLPYAKNTIQSFIAKARTKIRENHPNWYYRPHDLRATFATDWLRAEVNKRRVVFDFLIQELAVLLGHESTSTTQKYIDFMNSNEAKLEHSGAKNKVSQQALYGVHK